MRRKKFQVFYLVPMPNYHMPDGEFSQLNSTWRRDFP